MGRPKKYSDPTTTAQNEANKAYRAKNPEHTRYIRNRGTARSFIRNQAELDDLEELKQLIAERENELKN